LHDFVAIPDELAALGIGDVCGSVDEACAGASALLILNNCRRYSELTVAKTDIPILDAWNVCTKVERKSTLGNIRLEGAK
jgi:hypothetical protein